MNRVRNSKVKARTTFKRETLVDDLREVAYHEAGHVIAASHFGLAAEARILRVRRRPARDYKAYVGRTAFVRTTPFRTSIIGFAGILAHDLANKTPHRWKRELLERCEEFGEPVWVDDFSDSDREAILGHPARYRATKTAASILIKRFHELVDTANKLIENQTTNPDPVACFWARYMNK